MRFTGMIMMMVMVGLLGGMSPALAGELVSARYIASTGKEITVELTIGSPAPSSVIVIQDLPGGTGVVSSSPTIKMNDRDKGQAKWLLSKVSPGKMKISMTLDRSVASGEVSGEIRFRGGSGQMLSVAIGK